MEFEHLLSLIEAVSTSKLTDFKYEEDGVKIRLAKKQKKIQAATADTQPTILENPVPQTAADTQPEGQVIESPLVGTFYAAPSEDQAAFVSVGDTVQKGQTLAIVEAMKLMNEIESEYAGTIIQILAENGQAVEYGQPLFRIS